MKAKKRDIHRTFRATNFADGSVEIRCGCGKKFKSWKKHAKHYSKKLERS